MRRLLLTLLIVAGLITSVFALLHAPWGQHLLSGNSPDDREESAKKPYFDQPLNSPVDSLVATKHLRELAVYRHGRLLKIYRVALGHAPAAGHKHFEGDEKTPEGLYFIDGKNPFSACHKNLGISYPNSTDRAYARKHHLPAGGDIKIHGLPNGQGHVGKAHLLHNWTNGCIAMTDEEIDELYGKVRVGTPVLILP